VTGGEANVDGLVVKTGDAWRHPAGASPHASNDDYHGQRIRVYGDIAINSGSYSFSQLRDGRTLATPARFTMVFRNRDGRWMIVEHHSSRVPVP